MPMATGSIMATSCSTAEAGVTIYTSAVLGQVMASRAV